MMKSRKRTHRKRVVQNTEMATLPSELQRLLDDVDAADRSAEALAGSCSDEQFYWRPRGGEGWSIALCLDHLATINAVYAAAIRTGIDKARVRGSTRGDPAKPGFFGAQFVKSLEPPVKRRMRAPRKGRPAGSRDRKTILDAYRAAHETIRGLIRDAAAIDANRSTFANPFVPVSFRIATGLFVISAHDRRHLWQAEQVKRAVGFPATASDVTR